MSFISRVGQCIGGIRDVGGLKARCEVDEDTECWTYLGDAKSRGAPIVWLPALQTTRTAQFAALFLSDRAPQKGQVAYIRCKTAGCCNPAHISAGTRAQLGKHTASTGKLKHSARRLAANRENCRAARKLTEDQASDIRGSLELGRVLAERHGVSISTISKIRRGERYLNEMRGSSVFNWNPADVIVRAA